MKYATRTFTEYGALRDSDGCWIPRGQLGQLPLDVQIRNWVDASAVSIVEAVAPQVRVVRDRAAAITGVWLSVSLVYLDRQARVTYAKTFLSAQTRRRVDGKWDEDPKPLQDELDAQIKAWTDATGNDILAVSPPGFYHYWNDNEMTEKQIMTGVVVLYDAKLGSKGCSK